jgi:predicted dehydrogenase
MMSNGRVRWGILGTANIARVQFLPGLRAAGGEAAAVAGRDGARAEQFARENGIARAVAGYQRLVDDPEIDVLYIPLPNALHAEWTIAALKAGRPVLCEKPLCGRVADTERVLETARATGTLLWEAFVFPFHAQMERIRSLLAAGAIGELREIQSSFHFLLRRPGDIRLSAAMQGGALRDVGCYPVRLAVDLFGEEYHPVQASWEEGGDGVDIESWGMVGFGGGRRLLWSCGMRRGYDTFTRLLGTAGQIHISNPFHPRPGDHFEVLAGGTVHSYPAGAAEPSFTAALRHISAVLRGEQQPQRLAVGTALPAARILDGLARAGSIPV